ncbi:hypothetical protein ABFS83_10G115400 [Erythranthe nasuta]
MTDQLIHCKISCLVKQRQIQVSFVFGWFTITSRMPLWTSLANNGQASTLPWLCLGDFNTVRRPVEKSDGNVVTPYMVNDIQECCRLTGLDDLTSTGFYYTWSNHTVWSKLDRAMVNPIWLQTCGNSSATFLPFGKHSDHSPILVKMGVDGEPVSRPFRFFNMWTMYGDFKTIVQDVWTADRQGSRQWAVVKNLKALKSPLKILNRKEFGHISERAKRASLDLEESQ